MVVKMLSVVALAAAAGSASGAVVATAQPIPSGNFIDRGATAAVYSGIPGPYSAFAAATGAAGFDDYTSTEASSFTLAQFKFVGGVTTAGGQINFNFYNAAAVPVSSFTSTFAAAGDFIWTITLGALPDGSDSTFVVPAGGFVELVVGAGTTGRWFFTTTAPTIGSNNIAVGTGGTLNPQRYSAFEMVAVPAPGAAALVGLGGLVALRRRR